jgi:ankyrin repeat protein
VGKEETMQSLSGVLRLLGLLLLWFGSTGAAEAQFMREPPKVGTIHRAAYDGDLKAVQQMLTANKTLRENQSGKYGTPLHTAAGSGHLEIVRYLLKQGANANAAKTIGDNETILMSAALVYPGQTEARKLEIVKLLVAKGARVQARDRNALTALHNAASQGSARIVAFLVSHGADINAKTNADMTPLHYAVGYAPINENSVKTAQYLLSKRANLGVKFQGQSLVQYAERANRPQMVALLKKAGAK